MLNVANQELLSARRIAIGRKKSPQHPLEASMFAIGAIGYTQRFARSHERPQESGRTPKHGVGASQIRRNQAAKPGSALWHAIGYCSEYGAYPTAKELL